MPSHVKFQFVGSDGKPVWGQADVPNEVTLEQFLEEAQKSYGQIQQVEVGRSLGENLAEGAKDLGRGALKLVDNTIKGAMNLGAAESGFQAQSEEAKNAVQAYPQDLPTRIIPQPGMDSRARQYLRAGLEGIGATPFSPRMALAGFSGGVGSEVGGEHLGPVGAFTGGLLGTGLAMIPGMRYTNTQELAREALGDVNATDLSFAKGLSATARKEGLPLLPNQAMPRSSRLDDIADFLAQTHNAPKTQDILRAQPGQVALRSQVELAKLPGEVLPAQQAEDAMADAATRVIDSARKERTRLFQNALTGGQQAEQRAAEQMLARAQAAQKGENFANQTGQLWNKEDEISAVKQLAEILGKRTAQAVPVGGQGVNPRGFLLPGSAVGNKQGDAVIGTQANRGRAAGQGVIVMPQTNKVPEGTPAAPLHEPKVETFPRREPLATKEALLQKAQENLRNAGKVGVERLIAFDNGLVRYATEHSNQPAVVRLVNDLRASLRESMDGMDVWVTDPSKLKGGFDAAMKGEGVNTLGTATPARIMNRHHAQLDGLFKQTVATEGTPLREALDVFSAYSKGRVDPLKAGPVGRLAGKHGLAPDAEATTGAKLAQIFAGKRDVNGWKEIRTLKEELSQVEGGNEAFVNAAKTHLSNLVGQALSQNSNRVATKAASNFYASLASTPAQKRALEETLTTMAEAAGKDPETLTIGFQRFVQIAGAMAERPGRVTSFPAAEAQRIAGKSATGGAVKGIASPFYRAGQSMINRVSEKTLKELDQIFASPDALDQLEALARQPLMSRKAQSIVGGLLGSSIAQSGEHPAVE